MTKPAVDTHESQQLELVSMADIAWLAWHISATMVQLPCSARKDRELGISYQVSDHANCLHDINIIESLDQALQRVLTIASHVTFGLGFDLDGM